MRLLTVSRRVPYVPAMTEQASSAGGAGPGWRLTIGLLRRLPQGALSRAFGRMADVPIPRPLRRAVLGGFARSVGLDLSEAERPLEEYGSIGDLFVRRLEGGRRSWPTTDDEVASPVDGVLGRFGRIESGRALQAKGRDYAIAELLDEADAARRFDGGAFVTIYLSPRHYHRIHTPCPGHVVSARHVPGALLPVNRAAVDVVDRLFPRNERLICHMATPLGAVSVVAVGAFNVGRISAEFERLPRAEGSAADGPPAPAPRVWTTNQMDAPACTRVYEPPVRVRHADEIMAFRLGSTVVLLFEPGAVVLDAGLERGKELQVGQVIARRAPAATGSGRSPS